jgi:hypothetical protein
MIPLLILAHTASSQNIPSGLETKSTDLLNSLLGTQVNQMKTEAVSAVKSNFQFQLQYNTCQFSVSHLAVIGILMVNKF